MSASGRSDTFGPWARHDDLLAAGGLDGVRNSSSSQGVDASAFDAGQFVHDLPAVPVFTPISTPTVEDDDGNVVGARQLAQRDDVQIDLVPRRGT